MSTYGWDEAAALELERRARRLHAQQTAPQRGEHAHGYQPESAPKNPKPPQGGSGLAPPRKARGRLRPTKMNKYEARYATQLELRKAAGEIHEYRFEAMKLRLADRTFYTPDFFVLAEDGVIEVHEVKGFWREDARVKWKVAAEQFQWFRFYAATWDKKGHCWEIEEYR